MQTHIMPASQNENNFTLHYLFVTDQAAEGGPTKSELLEFLQNCDVSTASRVSSTFSSRAPSPSPSLMSIMYPGLKVLGNKSTKTSSPLTTPVLNVGKLKQPSSLSNLFQPITGVSHSNSSTSFNEVVGNKDGSSGGSARNGDGGDLHDENPLATPVVATKHETKSTSVQREEEQKDAITNSKIEQCKGSPEVTKMEPSKKDSGKSDLDGTIHQRSRSNEMDYFSLRSENDSSKVSAFRSPPGSMQVLRSCNYADSRHDTTTNIKSTSQSQRNHDLFQFPELPQPPQQQSSETNSSKTLHAAGETVGMETISSDSGTFSWLKEFDSSLWSTYFTSTEEAPKVEETPKVEDPPLET